MLGIGLRYLPPGLQGPQGRHFDRCLSDNKCPLVTDYLHSGIATAANAVWLRVSSVMTLELSSNATEICLCINTQYPMEIQVADRSHNVRNTQQGTIESLVVRDTRLHLQPGSKLRLLMTNINTLSSPRYRFVVLMFTRRPPYRPPSNVTQPAEFCSIFPGAALQLA